MIIETKEEFIANYKNSVKNGQINMNENIKHIPIEKIAETLYQIKKDMIDAFTK